MIKLWKYAARNTDTTPHRGNTTLSAIHDLNYKPKKELFFLFLYLDILCTVCHGKWEGRVGIQSAGVPGVCFAFTSEQMRAAPGSSSAAAGDTAAITYLSAFDNHFQILFEKLYC